MTGRSQTPRPRVALVHDWLTGMRGGEKVLEQLGELFPEAPIHTLFHFPGSVSQTIEGHTIHASFLQKYPATRHNYRWYLPLFPSAIEDFDLTSYDLIVSSSHCVAKGAQPRPGARHVCYCHTPMRYVWDQEHAYFPQRKGLVARLRGIVLSRLRQWDVATSGRVDLFIANSRFVAARIERYYGRQAEVVHPPVDTDFFTPAGEGAGGYCLVVAALSPYKRIDLAIAACERSGCELWIVGDGPERRRLASKAGAKARLLGWVEADRLRELYRRADCLIQPGVEDFGITAVEALACGCPVVALARGGVLDVVRDGEHGVLYGEADEPEALSRAIDKSRTIGFNQLNLRRRAEEFSPARFKDQLKKLLSRRSIGWELF